MKEGLTPPPPLDALRWRHELKFLLPISALPRLRSQLSRRMRPDAHNHADLGYRICSLYLDTHDLKHYRQKLDGLHTRQKVRLRVYGEEREEVHGELKIKRGELGAKVRRRFSLGPQPWDPASLRGHLLTRDLGPLSAAVAREGLGPSCWINYNRLAYVDLNLDTRVTLDMDLEVAPAWSPTLARPFLPPNQFILEVKYGRRLPLWLVRLSQDLGDRPRPLGKYCMGIEVMRRGHA